MRPARLAVRRSWSWPRTTSGFAKLLVQPARQKVGDKHAPLLLVDKYMTFKGTTDRAVQASGQNLHLYPGLRLSLDIGQVVPESVGGDLRGRSRRRRTRTRSYVKPVKDAKLYVVTKPIAGVVPKKAPKLVVGEAFETRFFAGRYKLHDDGRRSGVLKLEVNDGGRDHRDIHVGQGRPRVRRAGQGRHAEARGHVHDQVPGHDADVHRLHVHRRRQGDRRDDEDAGTRGGVLRGAGRGVTTTGPTLDQPPKRTATCNSKAYRPVSGRCSFAFWSSV